MSDLTDLDQMRAFATRHNMRFWRACYRTSRNGLFAWKAYREARRAGIDVPQWVLKYLDGAADDLADIGKVKDPKAPVFRALRIYTYGKNTAFSRAALAEERLATYQQYTAMTDPRHKPLDDDLKARKQLAAEHGKSLRTVTSWIGEVRGLVAH